MASSTPARRALLRFSPLALSAALPLLAAGAAAVADPEAARVAAAVPARLARSATTAAAIVAGEMGIGGQGGRALCVRLPRWLRHREGGARLGWGV